MAIVGDKAVVKLKSGESTSVAIKEMNSWELTISSEAVDTTSFDSDGWAENEPSISSWECSMEGFYSKTDTTGQKAIVKSIADKTKLEVELYYNKTDEAPSYVGEVVVTEFSTGAKLKEGVTVSFSCTGSGKLTTN